MRSASPLRLATALLAFAGGGMAWCGTPAPAVEATAAPAGMALIPAGRYAPLVRTQDEPAEVAVDAFWLDVAPVTNAEFLAFVRANPTWRRSAITPLFADRGYLADWADDLELGPLAPPAAPVVRVSWFAARAYARWLGKRLPTTAEWEHAAAAGWTTPRGRDEPGFQAALLAWLTRPTPQPLPSTAAGRPNFHGVYDLHGLVWEWVSDFNTAMVTGESRGDTGLERNLFCGAGAAGLRDPSDFPAFMRSGFRSSVRASYAVPNLGFRCARTP
jgi:sulfatase modifying factor 1